LKLEEVIDKALHQPLEETSEKEIQFKKNGLMKAMIFRSFRWPVTKRLVTLLKIASKDDVLCMLMAYNSLLASGMQYTYLLFDHYKSVGEKDKGGITECFASPLNSLTLMSHEPWRKTRMNFAHFCSLFSVLDSPFGSIGNFFITSPKTKIIAINPPYTEKVLLLAAERAIALLLDPSSPVEVASYIGPVWHDSQYEVTLRAAESKKITVQIKEYTWAEADAYDMQDEHLIPAPGKKIFVCILSVPPK
jgi:hypothetical protein